MIKDAAAKLLLVPLLGISIAIGSMWLSFAQHPFSILFLAVCYWVGVTFLLWQGSVAATVYIRNHPKVRNAITLKLFLVLFITSVISWILSNLAIMLWNKLFQNPILHKNTSGYAFLFVAIAPIIGLSYEILFLKKEQELDSKVVAQLDYERQSAELQALNNELEPHFIFNALNVLLPLIRTDTAKAQVFTTRLAQVYKYLLQNKDRELISLQEELNFIGDYVYLLQIRHENKLKLHVDAHEIPIDQVLILPFALQVLVENAIKHNQFSEDRPLTISIALNKQFIQLCNTVNPKRYAVESTNVGLKNLSARYRIISNKDVIIYHTNESFIVKLPLLKTIV